MTDAPFTYPPQFSFPPFFTRQPNESTYSHQRTIWSQLILSHARHTRTFRLKLPDAFDAEPFVNREINRKLQAKDALEILEFMEKSGDVEFVNRPKGGGTSGEVIVWWKKPEEWGAEIMKWIDDTGQKGAVLTLWELTDGDTTMGQDFHGLEPYIVKKALDTLVKKGQAQIFSVNNEEGVKFF